MKLTQKQKETRDIEVEKLLGNKNVVELIKNEIKFILKKEPDLGDTVVIDWCVNELSEFNRDKLLEYTGKKNYRLYSLVEAVKQVVIASKQHIRINVLNDDEPKEILDNESKEVSPEKVIPKETSEENKMKKYFKIKVVREVLPVMNNISPPYLKLYLSPKIIDELKEVIGEKLPSVRKANFSGSHTKNRYLCIYPNTGANIEHCKEEVALCVTSYIQNEIDKLEQEAKNEKLQTKEN